MSQARITANATTYIAGCRYIKQSIFFSCMRFGGQPQTKPQNAVWEIINENRLLQWHFEALKVSKNYVIARVCCLKYEKTTPTFIPLSWKSLTEDMEPDLCIRLPYFNWPSGCTQVCPCIVTHWAFSHPFSVCLLFLFPVLYCTYRPPPGLSTKERRIAYGSIFQSK